MPSWYTNTYSGQGANWSFGPKSGLTVLPHIIDVWHVPSVYVACEGLSDLGHGPNQPTATIIGGYSAYHTIIVHQYLLWSRRELILLQTKILPNFFTTHHWCLACSQRVCWLWRVVRPCSWTQPAYCNNHWWIQCLSYHHSTPILTLVKARIDPSADQNLA